MPRIFQNIPVDRIIAPGSNVIVEPELERSVQQVGIINPITVRLHDGRYEIIAGRRRYLAARGSGMTHIPAMVDDSASDLDYGFVTYTENMARSANIAGEIQAIADMIASGLPLDQIAAHFGLRGNPFRQRAKVALLGSRARSVLFDALRADMISLSTAAFVAEHPNRALCLTIIRNTPRTEYLSRDDLQRRVVTAISNQNQTSLPGMESVQVDPSLDDTPGGRGHAAASIGSREYQGQTITGTFIDEATPHASDRVVFPNQTVPGNPRRVLTGEVLAVDTEGRINSFRVNTDRFLREDLVINPNTVGWWRPDTLLHPYAVPVDDIRGTRGWASVAMLLELAETILPQDDVALADAIATRINAMMNLLAQHYVRNLQPPTVVANQPREASYLTGLPIP